MTADQLELFGQPDVWGEDVWGGRRVYRIPPTIGRAPCLDCQDDGVRLLPANVPGYEQAWRDAERVRTAFDGLHYLSCQTCFAEAHAL